MNVSHKSGRRHRWLLLSLSLLLVDSLPLAAAELLLPCNYRIITSGFGDSRVTHFHAGVDISTAGRDSAALVAIDDGFVSRLKVRHGGYGRALYLDTDAGLRAVYAHLSGYNARIDSLILLEQLRWCDYEVELHLAPGELPVQRGDTLGWSGQSGCGPSHLHFELRTADDIALNPQCFYPQLTAAVPPVAAALLITPCRATSRLNGFPLPLVLEAGDRFSCSGPVGIYFQAWQYSLNDHFPDGDPSLPAAETTLLFDRTRLGFSNDSLNFETNGWEWVHPSALGDGWRLLGAGNLLQRETLPPPCHTLSDSARLNLVVASPLGLTDSLTCLVSQSYRAALPWPDDSLLFHNGWIVVGPAALPVRATLTAFEVVELPAGFRQLIPREPGVIQTGLAGAETLLHLPAGWEGGLDDCGPWRLESTSPRRRSTLFRFTESGDESAESGDKSAESSDESAKSGEELTLDPAAVVLASPLRLILTGPEQRDWLYREQNGRWQPLDCERDTVAGNLSCLIQRSGRFAGLSDPLPPGLVFRHPSRRDTLVKRAQMVRIQVTDDLSGIGTFSCWVDSCEVYPEYDADRDRLFFRHDARINPGSHQLRVVAADRAGNRRERTLRYQLLD